MTTIGERIALIIEAKNLKKVQFAADLQIDQSYVTQLVNGRRNPSKRLLETICIHYNVDQFWLETGEGEMFIEPSRAEELSSFFADVQLDDGFKNRFVSGLAALDADDWVALERLINKMLAKRADEE